MFMLFKPLWLMCLAFVCEYERAALEVSPPCTDPWPVFLAAPMDPSEASPVLPTPPIPPWALLETTKLLFKFSLRVLILS